MVIEKSNANSIRDLTLKERIRSIFTKEKTSETHLNEVNEEKPKQCCKRLKQLSSC